MTKLDEANRVEFIDAQQAMTAFGNFLTKNGLCVCVCVCVWTHVSMVHALSLIQQKDTNTHSHTLTYTLTHSLTYLLTYLLT